jgi:cell division protein FtsB
VDETKQRWTEEASLQRSLAALEEKVLFDLLEESLRIELLASNQRHSAGELELLRERIAALAAELARLEDEGAAAEKPERLRDSSAWRVRSLDRQQAQVERELETWSQEDACGRRRRSRDRLWLEALLLERERLSVERRRIVEQGL